MELSAPPDSAACWHVRVPALSNPGRETYNQAARDAVAIIFTTIREISVLPDEEFDRLLNEALEADLISHIVFGVVFDVAYSGPVDAVLFARAPRCDCAPLRDDGRCPQPGHGLEFPARPGPGYSPERGSEQARERYVMLPPLLRSTLPALREDSQFHETVRSLRADGWPDWQILLAVFNVAKNSRMNVITLPRSREEHSRLRDQFLEPEPPGDPVSPEIFTADRLRESAAITLASTLLNHWHLAMRQNPVDQTALHQLLVKRYMYGRDDASHDDLFSA